MKRSLLILALSALVMACGTNNNIVNNDDVTNPADSNALTLEIDTPADLVTIGDTIIQLSTGLDNAYYVLNQTNRTGYFYAEVKAGHYAPDTAERSPLNLSLVIDRSGSMAGDKLKYVKEAAKFVVDNLGNEDYLSIVMYDDNVDVLSASAPVKDKAHLKLLIEQIFHKGSTNLSGGMLEGYNQVESTYDSTYVNRVLLLSDGLANKGITDVSRLQDICRKKNQEKGITISTFGVGADYNEDLMQALAEYGSGNYYFIETPDQIPQIFLQELEGLLSVVAQNMKMTITLPDLVTFSKAFGYQFEQKGQQLSVQLRDVFSDDTKAMLVKFNIADSADTEMTFTAKIEWDDVLSDYEHKSLESSEVLRPTGDTAVYAKATNITLSQQITVYEANEALQLAMKRVDQGRYDDARRIVKSNQEYLQERTMAIIASDGEATEEMHVQDSLNTRYKQRIQQVETMRDHDKKMMQKSSKSYNYSIRTKKAIKDTTMRKMSTTTKDAAIKKKYPNYGSRKK